MKNWMEEKEATKGIAKEKMQAWKHDPEQPDSAHKERKLQGRWRRAVLAVLLAAAVLLAFRSWYAPSPDEDGAKNTPAPSPVLTPAPTLPPENLTARQNREKAYEKDLATLRELSRDDAIQPETRQQAAQQMLRMTQQHQMELGLEEALTNAGFRPCLVLMQNDALTVAVSASEVTAAQSAVILSICLAHTEVAAENIRIMPGGV